MKEAVAYPKKTIECIKCGRISEVPKAHPIKFCWCKHCGAVTPNIRIWKG